MAQPESDRTVTTTQAASILGVSRPTVVRLCQEGHLPYAQPGRHRLLRLADVMAFKTATTHGTPVTHERTTDMPKPRPLSDQVRAQRALPPPPERRAIRLAAHVSLARVAQELGVSPATVMAWETGRYEPRPATLPAYAKLLAELQAATNDTQETKP